MTRRTDMELWIAEICNALGLIAFAAVLVLGAWLAQNWRM